MKRTAAVVLAIGVSSVAALTGCGSSSALSEDDQQFCSDQDNELSAVRDELDQLIDGDHHWSTDSEAYASATVVFDPAWQWLSSYRPQDPQLADVIEKAHTALFDAKVKINPGDDAVFDDDAAVLREAAAGLGDLSSYCDDAA